MTRNDDPTQPWNDPMHKDDPSAPHNDMMRRDDPSEPWNSPMGRAEDLSAEDRRSYGLPSYRPGYWDDEEEA